MRVPYGRLEGIMSKNENRLNFRMTDETAAKIERWYQEDNCRSKNEFIEKAVNCYADMLATGESTTLPRAVQSAIDARLKIFEDRIAALQAGSGDGHGNVHPAAKSQRERGSAAAGAGQEHRRRQAHQRSAAVRAEAP